MVGDTLREVWEAKSFPWSLALCQAGPVVGGTLREVREAKSFPWSLALCQAGPVVGGTLREVREARISRVGGLVKESTLSPCVC